MSAWEEWAPGWWARVGVNFILDVGQDDPENSSEWTASLCIAFTTPEGSEDVMIFLSEKFATETEAMAWADDQDEYQWV